MSRVNRHRTAGMIAFLLCLVHGMVVAKDPVPGGARQRELRAAASEAYGDGPGSASLAEKLVDRAGEADVQADEAFVLRSEAAAMFARAGSVAGATGQCEQIVDQFRIDPLLVRHPVLLALGGAPLPDADRALAVTLLCEHLVACEAAGRATFAEEATGAARRCAGRQPPELRKQIERAQADRARARKAAKKVADLLALKNDASAGEAGVLLCLELGRWSDGLPLLAKCRDASLAGAAAGDLTGPTGTAEQLAVAKAWWTVGEQLSAAKLPQRASAAKRRAGMWYAQCEPQLSGIPRDVARKRLADSGWKRDHPMGRSATDGSPAPTGAEPTATAGGTFDLFALIDLDKDVLAGDWKRFADGAYLGHWSNCTRIEVPYHLPDEYELTLEVAAGNSRDELSDFWLILPVRGGTDSAVLGFLVNRRERYSCVGIHNVDGRNYSKPDNPTSRRLANVILFAKDERRVLKVVSTRTNLRVSVNGKQVYDLGAGLGSRVWGKVDPPNRLLNAAHFGFGGHFTDVFLYGLTVRSLGSEPGKIGTRTTEDPALPRLKRTGARFGGHLYQQFPVDLSLIKARELCRAMGGALLVIDSREEQEFVSQMIRKSGVPAWIDLERPDGRWVGPDGAAPPYLPFGLERYRDPAEPYAHVAADGQVTSVHPVFPVSVVCEWAADTRRPPAAPRATGRRRPPVGERGRDLFDDHE